MVRGDFANLSVMRLAASIFKRSVVGTGRFIQSHCYSSAPIVHRLSGGSATGRRRTTNGDAVVSGEIVVTENLAETGRGQDTSHGRGLIVPVFQ